MSAFLRGIEQSRRNPARDSGVFARTQESRVAGLMERQGIADSDELVLVCGISFGVLAHCALYLLNKSYHLLNRRSIDLKDDSFDREIGFRHIG